MKIKWLCGTEDKTDCFAIREEIFVKEQGFHDEFDDIDNRAYHLAIYENEICVATARIFEDEQEGVYHAGRICVVLSHRKKHLGAVIMDEVMKKATELHAVKVVLSAQVNAQGFYAKQGFLTDGDVYMDEHCPHIDMYKEIK